MFIYKTTNLINGIIYIGKYCGVRETYIGSGKFLKNAIKKYGKENFFREILEDGIENHDYLCEREIYWIEFFDSANPNVGYNLSKGGMGCFGLTHKTSLETKTKISLSLMGHSVSEEYKIKISENHADFSGKNHPMWGKHHSEDAKKKISEILIGHKMSEDTKKKMSMSRKGKEFSENHRKNLSLSKQKGNHPKITKKEIVLQIRESLNKNVKIKDICETFNVCNETVYKVKNGFYDDIYKI
jgi:group I intron endonuclease